MMRRKRKNTKKSRKKRGKKRTKYVVVGPFRITHLLPLSSLCNIQDRRKQSSSACLILDSCFSLLSFCVSSAQLTHKSYTVEHRYRAPAINACPPMRHTTYCPLKNYVVISILAIRYLHYKA